MGWGAQISHVSVLWRESKDLEVPVKAGWHLWKLFKELGIVKVGLKH